MSVRPGFRLSLACLSLFTIAGAAYAQTKVGVVNLQRAVLDSAEIKLASDQMGAKYKPRQAEMEKTQKELQGISQNLQANAGKLTPEAEADLTAQGKRKERDLQRMQEDLQADFEREKQEILSKSSLKMQEVVKKVAEEKGLDMVVDASNAIFFKPALEITNDVLAAYDKAYPVKPAK